MTIEFSLRQRATQSRRFAVIYLGLAIVILVVAYVSFPSIAGMTLKSINQIEGSMANMNSDASTMVVAKAPFVSLHIFALIILILCLSAISFASYLLARSAFIEIESAARFNGLADALCIAGGDLKQFEIATAALVPRSKYFPELSEKNLKNLLDVVKTVRG
jgi:hypothetical protein